MRCKSRLDGIAVDEIDSPPEAIFEEELEVHVRVKRAPSFPELDEDIDIALFAPGKRSKDPDPPDAEAPDPFAVVRRCAKDTVSRKAARSAMVREKCLMGVMGIDNATFL
jgi:hypothetical protein